ncbi:MAG: cardiolipin synthase [Sandaracinaceae bacterium]|nr:cardiolipin synthase [Sandaracinaceae bacterium]
MPDLDASTLISALVTLSEIVSVAFIPLVLLRRKEPSSTFAWIFVLLAFPALGIVLFWYLGRDRVRRPVRTRLEISSEMRQRLVDRITSSVTVSPLARHSLIDAQPEEMRGVMRLATKMGRADLVPGNRVELLVGAQPTYDALIAAIDRASEHVHLEFYAFRRGRSAERVVEALERAVARGVKVRLLYDAFGSLGVGRTLGGLRRKGGRAFPFFPLDPIRRAATINLRNHRKVVVVDGSLGFCGGINVGDEFVPWRDVMLRIEGPAVAQLQAVFVEDWFFATRESLDDDACFPALEDRGESILQCVQSGPDQTVEAIHRLYFAAIAAARERVWISTPYFVPDRAVLVALQTAALRGVDVRLVVPAHSNYPIAKWAGESFYDELLEAGVRIFEYGPEMLHTKALVVDGRFATVGSANLDVRSFRLNFELVAVVYDEDIVFELTELHSSDQRASHELVHPQWSKRRWGARLREGVGRLLSPML